MKKKIATLDAQNALWMVGDYNLGVMPSAGRLKMLRGWRRANLGDRDVIASRHPGLFRAVLMTEGPDGLEALRTLVKDRLEAVEVAS